MSVLAQGAKRHKKPGLLRYPNCSRLSTATMSRDTYPIVGDRSHPTPTCLYASLTSILLATMCAPTPYFHYAMLPLAALDLIDRGSPLRTRTRCKLAEVRSSITRSSDVDATTANGDRLSPIVALTGHSKGEDKNSARNRTVS